MSQTILIEPNKDLKKIYALNLSSHANIEVIERSNAKEAIELIQILPNIDLIICADKVHEEKTAYTIYQYLQASQYNIPLIVLGEEQKCHNKVLQLKREISWELLTQHACETLGLAPEATANKNNFIPISINFFYSMNSTPCDIYIRIQKTSERFQFVKRLKASDSFNKQDNYVDWRDKSKRLLGKRYYYVFKKNELESLIDDKIIIVNSFYEKGNWGIILKKR